MTKITKVLIANRGEIAVRVIRTCQRLQLPTVVVYSEADADSLAVEMADEAVFIGPAPAAQSYLVADKIIAAARQTGADAIHPGFGFLSENPGFARRLEKEKITFIGPNPHAIEVMGDKITSKEFAQKAGVSTVPGHMDLIHDADEAVKISKEIGYPVMIKASAGGGGKGMRIAYNDTEAHEGFNAARSEAKSSFGDDRIFIEKFIVQPRHIEIQILGDKKGNVIHLNERECSIQRRNQKVIEEAPSPFLDQKTREAMGAQAVALAKAVNYDSAGTVEFIVDQDRNFYFLEMNTRLQVEHPVTECITGLDLVEHMIHSAEGRALSVKQKDVTITGWAMESRLYAEDPFRGFLPSIGRLKRLIVPPLGEDDRGCLTRWDSGVREGDTISMFYDPMIAKLVTHGPDRLSAIDAMTRALDQLYVEGLQPNTPFLSDVMLETDFRAGDISTKYIAEKYPDGFAARAPEGDEIVLFAATAAFANAFLAERRTTLSGQLTDPPAPPEDWVVMIGRDPVNVQVVLTDTGAEITLEGTSLTLETGWRPGQPTLSGRLDGAHFTLTLRPKAGGFDIERRAAQARVFVARPEAARLLALLPEKDLSGSAKQILSPMPGLILSVSVKPGDQVKSGQTLGVIEAMKMENILRAEMDGEIKAVPVKAGDSVAADDLLFEFV